VLGAHAGLATGTSLLIEEDGTTDYAGVLAKLFAAEGIVQGHQVHVVGLPDAWGRELPGLVEGEKARQAEQEEHRLKGLSTEEKAKAEERMKIAWRYQKLGQFGEEKRGTLSEPVPFGSMLIHWRPVFISRRTYCLVGISRFVANSFQKHLQQCPPEPLFRVI